MQALEDVARIRFAVREYGILVTGTSDTRLDAIPAGAMSLHDFWKSAAGREKEKHPAGGGDAKNPPPQQVEGVVKAIDDKSGLVTISVGDDVGLVKGNTLEVYRLKPEAKYVGAIQVIDTKEHEAVAKPFKVQIVLQVGDKVTSKIVQH